MKYKILGTALIATGFLFGVVTTAKAQEEKKPLVPIEDFTRLPKLNQVTFSPNGKLFAALQQTDGRMNLTVGDLQARKLTRITSFTTYDIYNYRWISNKRLVMSLYDSTKGLAEGRGGGLFAIDADGGSPKEISPTYENCEARNTICRQTTFVKRIADSEDEIIASANERDHKTEDLYRLNTRTGRKTLLTTDNPGNVSEWVLDKDNVPRAAISSGGKILGEVFWYRETATQPWRKISDVQGISSRRIRPAAFDSDGTLYVYSTLDSDKFQIYTFDAKNGKPDELIVAHPLVDLYDESVTPIIRSSDHKVVGFMIDADKPEYVWLDDGYAKMQSVLDSSLPKGNTNTMRLLDDGRVQVVSASDRDPGTYYMYDPTAKTIQEILRPRDWINPARMSSTEVVRYKARDGLEIPAYLTLPNGKAPSKLPLVAWIHGGPWARDSWGFHPDVQFLASRGYAVLQPNYRGSTGFGGRHLELSFKQYGQTMQDDITDGIRYLADKGIIDINRVCIGGGSYGGYATMQGLVKEPNLFRCGINEAGVTDLIWGQELAYTDFNISDSESSSAWYSVTMGDVKTDRAMLEQYSPRLHADKIKAPVLIIHGAGDRRVPIKHAQGMRDAMQAAGKEVEWVVYAEEGHGFVKPENKIDRYRKIEAFLAKYLNP